MAVYTLTPRGFTLIELVVVTVVVSILAAALAPLARNSLLAYDSTLSDLVAMDNLRYATERMAREIRGIRFAPAFTATVDPINPSPECPSGSTVDTDKCVDGTEDRFCITTMTDKTLSFRRFYCDSTGTVTKRNVTIDSAATANAVTLNYSDLSTQILTDKLAAATDLRLLYFQRDGVTAATAAGNVTCSSATSTCVRYVDITLTLKPSVGGVTQTFSQHTRVDLRNQ